MIRPIWPRLVSLLPHLVEFSLYGFDGERHSVEAMPRDLLELPKTLKTLRLGFPGASSSFFAVLASHPDHFSQLETLDLDSTADWNLHRLNHQTVLKARFPSKLTSLTWIASYAATPITEKSCLALENLPPGLTHLSLDSVRYAPFPEGFVFPSALTSFAIHRSVISPKTAMAWISSLPEGLLVLDFTLASTMEYCQTQIEALPRSILDLRLAQLESFTWSAELVHALPPHLTRLHTTQEFLCEENITSALPRTLRELNFFRLENYAFPNKFGAKFLPPSLTDYGVVQDVTLVEYLPFPPKRLDFGAMCYFALDESVHTTLTWLRLNITLPFDFALLSPLRHLKFLCIDNKNSRIPVERDDVIWLPSGLTTLELLLTSETLSPAFFAALPRHLQSFKLNITNHISLGAEEARAIPQELQRLDFEILSNESLRSWYDHLPSSVTKLDCSMAIADDLLGLGAACPHLRELSTLKLNHGKSGWQLLSCLPRRLKLLSMLEALDNVPNFTENEAKLLPPGLRTLKLSSAYNANYSKPDLPSSVLTFSIEH